MRLFRKKEKFKLNNKTVLWKTILFVVGAFISALSFNLFFVPNNFVSGGLSGLSIVFNEWFGWNSSLVILIGNLILIIISILTLGFRKSLLSIIGASVYTAFVYATQGIPNLINFSFDNVLLYVLAAGAVGGFGESLVYKSGFNTGGNSIVALIIQKYRKVPLGKLLRYISYAIIIMGGFTFGYTAVMYSIIISTISTSLVDKLLIGIGDSKTFFIRTTKEEEIKEFIFKTIESGVTELESKGAYTNKKIKLLMCVVPSEKYSYLKSMIEEIDPDAFVMITDCYDTFGGTKRKKLDFAKE